MNPRDPHLELDTPLQECSFVRDWIHALPEDTLSLAWRSQLNVRLKGEATHLSTVADPSTADSSPVKSWMQSLPEDVPSLAWRSQLNERLQKEMPMSSKNRSFMAFFKRPLVLGAAATVTMAIAVLNVFHWPAPGVSTVGSERKGSVEEAIVSTHVDMVAALDLGTSGPGEANGDNSPAKTSYYWNESDLESL